MIRLVGLGAGGHAKVVLDIIRQLKGCQMLGLLDRDAELEGTHVLGIPVLGTDDLVPELRSRGATHFFVGIGSIGDNTARMNLYQFGIDSGLLPFTAVHPAATVAASALLGPGATIMAGAVINPCAKLGANVIVNTGAIVEHDCLIEDHAHISPGACLLGGVHIGRAGYVGAMSVVRQGLAVGDGSIIGAGSVVVHDVKPGITVLGVPARPRPCARTRGNE